MRNKLFIFLLFFSYLSCVGQYKIQVDSAPIIDLNLAQIDFAEIGNMDHTDSNYTHHPKRLTKEQLANLNSELKPANSKVIIQNYVDFAPGDFWIRINYKDGSGRSLYIENNFIEQEIYNPLHKEIKEMLVNDREFLKNLWGGANEEECDCEVLIDLSEKGLKSENITKTCHMLDSVRALLPKQEDSDTNGNSSIVSEYDFGLIMKDSSNFFFITPQNIWIPKTDIVQTYRSNYSKPLLFMESPSRRAKVVSEALWKDNSDGEVLIIKGCHKGWIKASLQVNNKDYTGWIEFGNYCSNPYTTCN